MCDENRFMALELARCLEIMQIARFNIQVDRFLQLPNPGIP
jgi:hypothetical protein